MVSTPSDVRMYARPPSFAPEIYRWVDDCKILYMAKPNEVDEYSTVIMDCTGTTILNEPDPFDQALRIYGLIKQLTLAGIKAEYMDTPVAIIQGNPYTAQSYRIDKEQLFIDDLVDKNIKTVYVYRANITDPVYDNKFHNPHRVIIWGIAT